MPAKYEPRTLEQSELYDLENDASETTNVAAKNPEIVKQLEAFAEKAREDLGASLTNRKGTGVSEGGRAGPGA